MSDDVDDLDDALDGDSEEVVLRRTVAGQVREVTVIAHVRTYRLNAQELVNGISWIPLIVVISPTQIKAAGWPAGESAAAPPFNVDPSIPRIGDKMIIKGAVKTIKSSNPIMRGGEWVRCNIMTDG